MNADIAMIVVSCLRDFCFDVSIWAKIEIQNFEMWRNQHNSEIENWYLSKSAKLKNLIIEICGNTKKNSKIWYLRCVVFDKSQNSKFDIRSFSTKPINPSFEIYLFGKQIWLLVHFFIDSFNHSFMQSFIHAVVHPCGRSFIDSFVHSFIYPITHSCSRSFTSRMNEWVNEWTNEWMDEWTTAWMNDWMNQ